MPISYIIMAFTALISWLAFNNADLFHKLKHWPYAEARRNEHYRWLTGGFLHGDIMHLVFNMITLYYFGPLLEQIFFAEQFPPGLSNVMYILFYLLAIVASSVATYFKYRESPGFASIGASGAVSAVLFAAILILPTLELRIFFAIPMPGFLFGVLYLWYSAYAARQGGDNIDHTAHFYGAVFGFTFPLVFQPHLLIEFFQQIGLMLGLL